MLRRFLITILVGLFFSLSVPARSVSALDLVMQEATNEENKVTVDEAGDVVESKEGVWLRNVITWIPVVGAAFFVVGILIAVLSTKSNEHRRWGLRMAIVESIVAFVIYFAACITYDRYYHNGQTAETPDSYYLMCSENESLRIGGLREVYDNVVGSEESSVVASFTLLKELFKKGSLIIGITCFMAGVVVFLMSIGKKNIQRWAVLGLCVAAPLAVAVGMYFV